MTLDELKKHLKFWQEQLRLQDVDITLRWAQFLETTNIGSTTMRCDYTAALVILQPAEYISTNTTANIDYEVTLVHELLHIQERFFFNTKAMEKLIADHPYLEDSHELAIERNAQALVRVRRLGNG